jgi:hypothetical protein
VPDVVAVPWRRAGASPPPPPQLHPPSCGVGSGDELGQLQRRRSPSYKVVLLCQIKKVAKKVGK